MASNPEWKVELTPKRTAGVFAVATGLVASKLIPGAREVFPSPFDLGNHIANAGISMFYALSAGRIAGQIVIDKFENAKKATVRTSMAVGGLVIGAVVNGIGESDLMKLVYQHPTGDPLDIAYGVIGATAAATFGPKIIHRQSQALALRSPEPDGAVNHY